MAFALSGLVKTAQKAIIRLNGRVKRSVFYLTNLATGEKITLCMAPEEVKAQTESNFRTWNIIEKGQVSLPKGERLTQISWQGILPGANILVHNFVKLAAWEKPKEIVKTLTEWRESGDKIKVLITQTPINMSVYIKSFSLASGHRFAAEFKRVFVICFRVNNNHRILSRTLLGSCHLILSLINVWGSIALPLFHYAQVDAAANS